MNPAETVTTFLVTRFRSAIRGGHLQPDDPLISSGIVDSFGLMELIAFLEDSFHVTIDPSRHNPTDFETVTTIVDTVERARRNTSR